MKPGFFNCGLLKIPDKINSICIEDRPGFTLTDKVKYNRSASMGPVDDQSLVKSDN